jgi:hypothetical protein
MLARISWSLDVTHPPLGKKSATEIIQACLGIEFKAGLIKRRWWSVPAAQMLCNQLRLAVLLPMFWHA